MRDKILLRQLQALPLDAKILMTQQRIREWYNFFNGNVFISFSGGKDSTVLTHLVHDMYPNVPLVFANTGLEYPEIQAFARDMGAEFVRPKMRFDEVITQYGYPIISKEVAEAISFARRIVPIGGYNTTSRESSNESNFKDYGETKKEGIGRTTGERTAYTPPYKEEQGGGEQTSQDRLRYPRQSRLALQGTRPNHRLPPPYTNQNPKQFGEDQISTGTERTTKNQEVQKATHGEVTKPG